MSLSAHGPDPTLRRALDTVRRAVRNGHLWARGEHVLLGCSGGLDSMVALELLVRLRPSLGHDLAVGHVDHALRAQSSVAAGLVEAAAGRHGLRFGQVRLTLGHGAQLEARARLARYAALQTLGRDLGCHAVATAHHADDQAETLLLRLARGAGLDALAGIRRRREDTAGDLPVVRPLLDLDRPRLLACAQRLGIAWDDDPSNLDFAFARNDIRHRVLPALEAVVPGAAAGLARTADHLADHEGVVGTWIGRAVAGRLLVDAEGAWLDAAAVPGDAAAVSALVRYVCNRLGVPPPSSRAVDAVRAMLLASDDDRSSATKPVRIHGLEVSLAPGGWRFRPFVVAETGSAD